MMASEGRVDLVGGGPGDPGLMTIAGRRALGASEVVVYDHLIHPRLLDLAPAAAERVFAGKTAGRCAMDQPAINALLIDRARRGLRVVRLKGGDPYVFGRGAEEAEALAAAGVAFRVIPGVTAGVGVTAYAGIPITHRETASAVAFVTGHDDPGSPSSRVDWEALARFPGTLVVYMGVGRLRSLCETLVRLGKSAATPAALIQSGTLASQTTVAGTVSDLADRVEAAGSGSPALLVIGDVVARLETLNWYERLPLFGRRIVVTRPANEAMEATLSLEDLGAETLLAPTIRIERLDDFGALDAAIGRLSSFDWLVFTSGNGVRHFFDRLEAVGRDLRAVGHLRFAAIGPATAGALATFRLKADLVPDSYRSEALAEALIERAKGGRILLARADRGRDVLREELGRIAQVNQVAVYRNIDSDRLPLSVVARIAEGSVDWITLTSSAIARNLHELLPDDARRRVGRDVRLASISPITTEAAARLGWKVDAEAEEATWDGLVRAIVSGTRDKSRTPARG